MLETDRAIGTVLPNGAALVAGCNKDSLGFQRA